MNQQRNRWVLAAAVAAALVTALTHPAGAGPRPPGIDVAEQQPASGPATTYVYAVDAPSPAAAEKLAKSGFDLLENRTGDTLYVAGDAAVGQRLAAAGFPAEVAQTMR